MGWFALWLGLFACSGGPPAGVATEARDILPLLGGCATWTGDTCGVAAEAPVQLVVPWPEGWLATEADGVSLVGARGTHALTDAGAVVTFPAPSPGQVSVTISRAGPDVLAATATFAPPGDDPVASFRAQRARDPRQARDALQAALPDLPDAAAGPALSLLARLSNDLGDVEDAHALLAQAIARHDATGRTDLATADRLMRVYLLTKQGGDLGLIRHLLEEADASGTRDLALRLTLALEQGMVGERSGNLRLANTALLQAGALAEALDSPRHRAAVAQERALVLQRMGRHGDAVAAYQAAHERARASDDPCVRARAANNLAWALVRARDDAADDTWALEKSDAATTASLPDPLDLTSEAETAFADGCADPGALRANLLLTRAFAELVAEDADAASRTLGLLSLSADDELDPLLWLEEAQGRVLLAKGEASVALGHFERQARVAVDAGRLEHAVRGLVHAADALIALDRRDEALVRLEEAAALHEEQAWRVPLDVGRAAYLSLRERATRTEVLLLLADQRPDEAFDVMRRFRVQLLGSLALARRLEDPTPEARERWEAAVSAYDALRSEREALARDAWKAVSPEALAALEARRAALDARSREALDLSLGMRPSLTAPLRDALPGEVMLGWMPAGATWLAFARTLNRTHVARIPTPDPHAPLDILAIDLLGPFTELLTVAGSVTLLPYGVVQGVDLHMLPVDGQPLIARVPVQTALDIPASQGATGTGALVVSDPRSDLPEARQEGALVAERLRAGTARLQGDAATREALMSRLPQVALLHYAGHGAYGDGPWTGALRLADRGELTVPDLLRLPAVPPRVVLSGCETARTEATAVEHLGLAQAFVTAGTRAAVAAARKVDDRLALDFSRALYDAGFAAGPADVAFAKATREVLAETPEADVGAFRLIVP